MDTGLRQLNRRLDAPLLDSGPVIRLVIADTNIALSITPGEIRLGFARTNIAVFFELIGIGIIFEIEFFVVPAGRSIPGSRRVSRASSGSILNVCLLALALISLTGALRYWRLSYPPLLVHPGKITLAAARGVGARQLAATYNDSQTSDNHKMAFGHRGETPCS